VFGKFARQMGVVRERVQVSFVREGDDAAPDEDDNVLGDKLGCGLCEAGLVGDLDDEVAVPGQLVRSRFIEEAAEFKQRDGFQTEGLVTESPENRAVRVAIFGALADWLVGGLQKGFLLVQ